MDFLKYSSMIDYVLVYGQPKESRLGSTMERINFHVSFPMGQLFYRPGMNRNLGWLESFEVLGGTFTPWAYNLVSPKLVHKYDWDAAYGVRIGRQLELAADQLRNVTGEGNRRVIVHIGDPTDAGERPKPCIDSYQFIVNDGKLDLIASIRSWDLTMGFVYDTMVMGVVGLAMSKHTGFPPGSIHCNAASAHIYKTDVDAGRLENLDDYHDGWLTNDGIIYGDDWRAIVRQAQWEKDRLLEELSVRDRRRVPGMFKVERSKE